MNRLLVLGLNHTTAPLELREKLAFNAAERAAALVSLRSQFGQCEAVLLSTCNRVELYVARPQEGLPSASELTDFLAQTRGLAASELKPHLYEKTERQVVEHLFRVVSSLDSMVLGETQILGQVREAYDAARAGGAAGHMLHPLFQRAVAVGRQVMSETALGNGRLSIATIAIDYARQIFDTFNDKVVLSIGAGEMASLVLSNFAALSPGDLLVCNRDTARAQSLAQEFNGRQVPFEDLADHLAVADIVVSSTGSTEPIISRAMFEQVIRRRRYRPVFLIDIAVPRDVAADVGKLENVYLYNLDDLHRVVASTREQRSGAVDAADQIVAQHVQQFASWHRTREMGPIIDQLFRRSHALAQEELARTLAKFPDVSPAQKQSLEELARRIVNKLLHDPVHMLRQADSQHAPTSQYLHAMEKLFKLDGKEPKLSAESQTLPNPDGPTND
ncbi:MAG: glutamyl-tRNA reductase [Planctomycetota bacterium]|nr:glutamyl-tRNA reductase [Planctomycetota bacterium]